MPATTNESVSAGPARVAEATPVRTKMPVPMIAPMPIAVSAHGPSDRLRPPSSFAPSARIRASGFTRCNSMCPGYRPRPATPSADEADREGVRVGRPSLAATVPRIMKMRRRAPRRPPRRLSRTHIQENADARGVGRAF